MSFSGYSSISVFAECSISRGSRTTTAIGSRRCSSYAEGVVPEVPCLRESLVELDPPTASQRDHRGRGYTLRVQSRKVWPPRHNEGMQETACDVLIVGGGTGGVAAALAATAMGLRVILTEETDWVGGQLTSQAVPPDEHPWIESFGCTWRYRRYREVVRNVYRTSDNRRLKPFDEPLLNPGGGWVSNLCHAPSSGAKLLRIMLEKAGRRGHLDLRLRTIAQGTALLTSTVPRETGNARPVVEGDLVRAVALLNLDTGEATLAHAKYILDATELGDLLPLTGTEFVQGAESGDETGEPHAPSGPARPDNQQGFTWCMAVAHDPGSHRVIDKPEGYERWAAYAPEGWRGKLFGYGDLTPATNEPREMPLFSDDWRCWFKYRQIVKPREGTHGATIVNWPQNDYFVRPLTDPEPWIALEESRQMSLSWLYWMQTEGGAPGLYLRPDLTGTKDGLAKAPYIRESRRIRALRTIKEGDVVPQDGRDRAPIMADSVGIGAYRIDLHFTTGGDRYIDVATLPFEIPLGALVPQRIRNLIPACKNIGTTHITNGCYRLHPVEWNIGEAAGLLAAFCIGKNTEPHAVHASEEFTQEFQNLLRSQGVETAWPTLHAL